MLRGVPRLLAIVAPALAGALLAAPSAGADTLWLCKPGMAANPCEPGMSTTIREPSGASRIEDPLIPRARPVDCFYVYPTVSNQLRPNATRTREPEVVSIARYQAARFSLRCRVFAPVYRQGTLLGLATGGLQDTATIRRTAFADVRDAWRDYLADHNDGRGVVLIGHSQGTGMLRQLIRTEIDPDATARRRMISALLLGGDVVVRRGRTAGGDFANVPVCTRPAQLSCVVAYSTFAEDPPDNARFGRLDGGVGDPFGFPTGPQYEVACTDPSRLAGITGPLELLVPSEPYAPGPIAAGIVVTSGGVPPSASTPWVVPRDRATGGCATVNGSNVLRFEPTPGSRRPLFFPDPTWGTHLIDVNLTLDRLLEIVRLQSARYLEPRLRLTRRCAPGGRLRVGVSGDTDLVRGVSFKLDRRRVAHDAAEPFSRTLSRRTLRRGRGARRLRAVANLAAGAPARLVLARPLPRCGR